MNDPLVRISTGFLRGSVKNAINGKPFYSFDGIPFGEPPIGRLRFKSPVPAKPWEGVRDATTRAPPNFSPILEIKTSETGENSVSYKIGGSEDCLYLNVSTKSLPNDKYDLKPVMVFIHGGAFIQGGTQEFGHEVLLTEDVVLVTIPYRMGALGFLAIDDPELEVTGNAALKDMVLALKWVNKNIKVFNGDPNNVTVFGESAGAAATHYLVLSPTTKGLIHKAILESGTAICTWARANPLSGLVLAEKLGCTSTDKKEILAFLQNIPAVELVKCQLMAGGKYNPSSRRLLAPVIENPLAKDAFLTEDPRDILLSGKYNDIPLMVGVNSDEAALFNIPIFKKDSLIVDRNVVPFWFGLDEKSVEYEKLRKRIREFYLKGNADRTVEGYLSESAKKLVSDVIFIRPAFQTVKLHKKKSQKPIFVYRFSVVTKLAHLTKGKNKGVCHADDLGYQFLFPDTPEVKPGSIEDISRRRFVNLLTNFARTGNPNSNDSSELIPIYWDPVAENEIKLLDIGEKLSMETNPEAEYMTLWDEISQSYEHAKFY